VQGRERGGETIVQVVKPKKKIREVDSSKVPASSSSSDCNTGKSVTEYGYTQSENYTEVR
jgi:hypothetical protein